MSIGLPTMAYGDGIRKYKQTTFGGYNHTLAAENGELWDMQNLTSDLYPILSPRKPRYLLRTLTKPNGFYAHDGLYWVDGTGFYADGTSKGTVTDSKKRFTSLGAYIVILPDKKYYNVLTEDFGSIEASVTRSVTIQDGTYAGEAAEANTIYSSGAAWEDTFSVGDVVSITGCVTHMENNKKAVIREIDGDYLRFYENCFVISTGGDTETATIQREMPDLDFICENENRLWGCKGDTIYASKLGDIFGWEPVTGEDIYGYQSNVGSAGDFTGCCSYLGYPCFFKEEHIYKVYGSKPSDFQVMPSASLGVENGSGGSLAIAGEVLFYLSRSGIVAYSGGIPQSVSAAFGTERYKDAAAGSDGTKYYVSMKDAAGAYSLFVFDTRTNLWCREDGMQAIGFGWNEELYFLGSDGKLWLNGNARTAPQGATVETGMEWVAEWADFYEYTSYSNKSSPIPEKKGIGKLLLRLELDEAASVTIKMQFDSDGTWRDVKTLTTATKRSYHLPIIPRRCDHFRIKMEGTGGCRIYSLAREVYVGSEE